MIAQVTQFDPFHSFERDFVPVKILPGGCWKWSCNEACCQHGDGEVLIQAQIKILCFNVFPSVNQLVIMFSCSYWKICSMMASFSEGLLLGEKVGLDPNVIVEVLPRLRPHFL